MHNLSWIIVFLSIYLQFTNQAPIEAANDRSGKSLYFDYVQPEEMEYNYNDYVIEDNDLSRTIPNRKRTSYNSPIYYIRLPPQPYMFVPGLGYMPQPPPSPVSQFVNLPVSFVANGKPSTIYQWSGGMDQFPSSAPPIKPAKRPIDSNIHRLPGHFSFNGKPEDIFVLRDSYNSLYGDALQNFYP